jgi:polyhydroxyalkanoate synthesis repressor PhaR
MLHRNAGTRSGQRLAIVKKYSNRRLYDPDQSRYITLEELADKIRKGADVQIVDAKTGQDLTQATLTQLILEGPAARLLPVGLLRRLIRMHDDALAEFFSKYVTWALDLYLAARDGAQQVAPLFPFAGLPMQATHALLRLFGGGPTPPSASPSSHAPPPPMPNDDASLDERESARDEIAKLREELEALKASLRKPG